jgi:hypothetical protein
MGSFSIDKPDYHVLNRVGRPPGSPLLPNAVGRKDHPTACAWSVIGNIVAVNTWGGKAMKRVLMASVFLLGLTGFTNAAELTQAVRPKDMPIPGRPIHSKLQGQAT